jgi:hypothetical protein
MCWRRLKELSEPSWPIRTSALFVCPWVTEGDASRSGGQVVAEVNAKAVFIKGPERPEQHECSQRTRQMFYGPTMRILCIQLLHLLAERREIYL